MTRHGVLYQLMSLDGYADDPGEGDWFRDADEHLGDFLRDAIASQDTVLLGRRTYEKWAPYWPTATMQPFADFINTTLTAHLVDELRLVLAPSLAGHGKRLFDGNGGLQHFQLMTAQRSGGCLLLHYRRHPQNRTDRATAQGS